MQKTFQQRVIELTKQIPRKKVTTYKELAKALKIKAYRAVGHALHCNKNAPVIPCHRVINSNGSLGGYNGGVKKKIRLLKKEGIIIHNNKIDLKKYNYSFSDI